MQKFTKQLPKEDLKKFAKEVGKKLVASDFKNNRVENPTKISEKQEKKVKQYVREFFEKAVEKKKVLDEKRKEKEARKLANGSNGVPKSIEDLKLETKDDADEDEAETMELTPNSPIDLGASPHRSIPATPSLSDLKRKRDDTETDTLPGGGTGEDSESNKRLKEESSTPPPPPPPPPPAESPLPLTESIEMQMQEETEEEKELRRQEEDLMRENEEAMMMDMDGMLPSADNKAGLNGISTADHPSPISNPVLEKVNGNGYKLDLGLNIDGIEQFKRRR